MLFDLMASMVQGIVQPRLDGGLVIDAWYYNGGAKKDGGIQSLELLQLANG